MTRAAIFREALQDAIHRLEQLETWAAFYGVTVEELESDPQFSAVVRAIERRA